MERVKQVLNAYAGKITGMLGVGFRDLDSGEEYYINGSNRFPSASVFKVPVLVELFAQVDAGVISLDTMYTLREEDIAPGSGALSVLTPGLSMSVRDYATLMMILSDNTGTDITYKLVGREKIRAGIDALGLENTRSDLNCRELILTLYGIDLATSQAEVARIFREGGWAAPINEAMYKKLESPNDISSPRDMVKVFSMIWNREILSAEACEGMLGIMGNCQTNSRIPYYLPQAGKYAAGVMHKTGTLRHVANDCGIVTANGKAYALALFYNGFDAGEAERADSHFGDRLLAELSRDVFNAFHGL